MKCNYRHLAAGIVLPVFLAALMSACGSSSNTSSSAPPPSTYYVKATGNDNNAGTSEDAPFATLDKAIYEVWANGDAAEAIVVIGTLDIPREILTANILSDSSRRRPDRNSSVRVLITGKADAQEAERAVLRGNGKSRILTINRFSNDVSATFIRLEHITITGGISDKNGGGIYVEPYNELVLGPGAVITGNQAKYGGGIYVDNNSDFSLEGGAITDNTASESGGGLYLASSKAEIKSGSISGNQAQSGGGVYAGEYAELTLEDGEISNNIAATTGSGLNGYGGGVVAFKFTMKGGSISGNTVNGGSGYGSGVAIFHKYDLYKEGTFIMEGGEIINNTTTESSAFAPAVFIYGNFTLRNGKIANNLNKAGNPSAVGIFIQSKTWTLDDEKSTVSFTMEGGEITGNVGYGVTAVYVNWTMRGGTISGNQIGVRLASSSFTMRGGEITNNSTTKDAQAAGIEYGGSTVTIQGGKVSGNTVKGKEVNLFELK